MRGLVIDHPERVSGSWEVKGDHAIYGLHIQLTSRVHGAPITLIGVQQIFHSASIEVYERTGPTRRVGDGNWFSDESPRIQWTDRHLLVKQPGTQIGPEVQLDLTFDPVSDRWSGRFRRGTFDRSVTLLRPHPETAVTKSPFVGTWSRPALMNNCVHIVQTGSEALAGWSDDLATPGALRYANGIRPPVETFEHYGSVALVEVVGSPRTVMIKLKALTAICCSITYFGNLAPNGEEIQGTEGGGDAMRSNWTRVRGNSCVAESTAKR